MKKRMTSLLLCIVMVLTMLATAVPMAAAATEYPITVDGGKAYATGGDLITKAAAGTTVTIVADTVPDKWFKNWEIVAGNITLAHADLEETTFVMPSTAVSVKAVYKPIPKEISDVAITLPAPVAGQSAAFAFIVPTGAGYKMSDRSGDKSGDYCSWAEFDTYPSAEDLGIADWKSADEPFVFAAGKYYAFTAYLEVNDGYQFNVGEDTPATLNGRPAECYGLFWRYANLDYIFYCEDPTADTYPIVVNGGKSFILGENWKDVEVTEAQAGTEIHIRANDPPEGQEFDCWIVNYGDLNFSSVYSSEIFTMPASAVFLTARYADKSEKEYSITSGDWWPILGKPASFVSDAPYEKFEKVRVDNADVSPSDYILENENGATKITFSADFISSRYIGQHALCIVSTDGAARTDFLVCNGISTIEVTDVVEPVAGKLSEYTHTLPTDAGYQQYYGTVAWTESVTPPPDDLEHAGAWEDWAHENKTGGASTGEGTQIHFRAGYYYTFAMLIEAKEGFRFEDDLSATVNGNAGQFLKNWGPLSDKVIYTFGPLPGTADSPLVRVTPAEVSVAKGGTQQFTAIVEGLEDQSVSWSLKGSPTSPDTRISGTGLLTVGADETVARLEVVALSTAISSQKNVGTACVTVKRPGDSCEGYTDIDRSAWYHGAADFVIQSGYMGSTRTDKLTFEPTTKVSRAMVAQIMYKICGSPPVSYQGKFADVPEGKWYTNAIEWCAQHGLAAGSNGKFNPNGNVTRQELTVFMRSLAKYMAKNVTGRAALAGFPDASKVPAWALDAVQWAVDYGIISGQKVGDKTYLNPTAGATRAELAAILKSFLTK